MRKNWANTEPVTHRCPLLRKRWSRCWKWVKSQFLSSAFWKMFSNNSFSFAKSPSLEFSPISEIFHQTFFFCHEKKKIKTRIIDLLRLEQAEKQILISTLSLLSAVQATSYFDASVSNCCKSQSMPFPQYTTYPWRDAFFTVITTEKSSPVVLFPSENATLMIIVEHKS